MGMKSSGRATPRIKTRPSGQSPRGKKGDARIKSTSTPKARAGRKNQGKGGKPTTRGMRGY